MRHIVDNHPKKSGLVVGLVEGAVIGFIAGGPPGALAGGVVGAATGLAAGAIGEHYECAFEAIVGAAIVAAVGAGAGALVGPAVVKTAAAEAGKIAAEKALEAGLAVAEQLAAKKLASDAVIFLATKAGAAIGGAIGGAGGGWAVAKYESNSLRARIEALTVENTALRAARVLHGQQHPVRVPMVLPAVPLPAAVVPVAEVVRDQARLARKAERYRCPITHRIMRDPVIASDHNSYERIAVENLIREARVAGVMPMSPGEHPVELVGELPLPANRLLKADIDEFIADHPEFNEGPDIPPPRP